MHFLRAAVLIVQFGSSPAASKPVEPRTGLPCPIEVWSGFCNYMTEEQKEQLRVALRLHSRVRPQACVEARDALQEWLADRKQAWVFELHSQDDASTGTYVLGQTVGVHPANGFGLRIATFTAADSYTLASIALHEGAHLAGQTEERAIWVERHCVRETTRRFNRRSV
jgi:hypothetical protein